MGLLGSSNAWLVFVSQVFFRACFAEEDGHTTSWPEDVDEFRRQLSETAGADAVTATNFSNAAEHRRLAVGRKVDVVVEITVFGKLGQYVDDREEVRRANMAKQLMLMVSLNAMVRKSSQSWHPVKPVWDRGMPPKVRIKEVAPRAMDPSLVLEGSAMPEDLGIALKRTHFEIVIPGQDYKHGLELFRQLCWQTKDVCEAEKLNTGYLHALDEAGWSPLEGLTVADKLHFRRAETTLNSVIHTNTFVTDSLQRFECGEDGQYTPVDRKCENIFAQLDQKELGLKIEGNCSECAAMEPNKCDCKVTCEEGFMHAGGFEPGERKCETQDSNSSEAIAQAIAFKGPPICVKKEKFEKQAKIECDPPADNPTLMFTDCKTCVALEDGKTEGCNCQVECIADSKSKVDGRGPWSKKCTLEKAEDLLESPTCETIKDLSECTRSVDKNGNRCCIQPNGFLQNGLVDKSLVCAAFGSATAMGRSKDGVIVRPEECAQEKKPMWESMPKCDLQCKNNFKAENIEAIGCDECFANDVSSDCGCQVTCKEGFRFRKTKEVDSEKMVRKCDQDQSLGPPPKCLPFEPPKIPTCDPPDNKELTLDIPEACYNCIAEGKCDGCEIKCAGGHLMYANGAVVKDANAVQMSCNEEIVECPLKPTWEPDESFGKCYDEAKKEIDPYCCPEAWGKIRETTEGTCQSLKTQEDCLKHTEGSMACCFRKDGFTGGDVCAVRSSIQPEELPDECSDRGAVKIGKWSELPKCAPMCHQNFEIEKRTNRLNAEISNCDGCIADAILPGNCKCEVNCRENEPLRVGGSFRGPRTCKTTRTDYGQILTEWFAESEAGNPAASYLGVVAMQGSLPVCMSEDGEVTCKSLPRLLDSTKSEIKNADKWKKCKANDDKCSCEVQCTLQESVHYISPFEGVKQCRVRIIDPKEVKDCATIRDRKECLQSREESGQPCCYSRREFYPDGPSCLSMDGKSEKHLQMVASPETCANKKQYQWCSKEEKETCRDEMPDCILACKNNFKGDKALEVTKDCDACMAGQDCPGCKVTCKAPGVRAGGPEEDQQYTCEEPPLATYNPDFKQSPPVCYDKEQLELRRCRRPQWMESSLFVKHCRKCAPGQSCDCIISCRDGYSSTNPDFKTEKQQCEKVDRAARMNVLRGCQIEKSYDSGTCLNSKDENGQRCCYHSKGFLQSSSWAWGGLAGGLDYEPQCLPWGSPKMEKPPEECALFHEEQWIYPKCAKKCGHDWVKSKDHVVFDGKICSECVQGMPCDCKVECEEGYERFGGGPTGIRTCPAEKSDLGLQPLCMKKPPENPVCEDIVDEKLDFRGCQSKVSGDSCEPKCGQGYKAKDDKGDTLQCKKHTKKIITGADDKDTVIEALTQAMDQAKSVAEKTTSRLQKKNTDRAFSEVGKEREKWIKTWATRNSAEETANKMLTDLKRQAAGDDIRYSASRITFQSNLLSTVLEKRSFCSEAKTKDDCLMSVGENSKPCCFRWQWWNQHDDEKRQCAEKESKHFRIGQEPDSRRSSTPDCAQLEVGLYDREELPTCYPICNNIFEGKSTLLAVAKSSPAEKCDDMVEGDTCTVSCIKGTHSKDGQRSRDLVCQTIRDGKDSGLFAKFPDPPTCKPTCEKPDHREGRLDLSDCPMEKECFGDEACVPPCMVSCYDIPKGKGQFFHRKTSGRTGSMQCRKKSDTFAEFDNLPECKPFCDKPSDQYGTLDNRECDTTCEADSSKCKCKLQCYGSVHGGGKTGDKVCKFFAGSENSPAKAAWVDPDKSTWKLDPTTGTQGDNYYVGYDEMPSCLSPLKVIVKDSQSGDFVEGVKVKLSDEEGNEEEKTKETEKEGRCEFFTAIRKIKLEFSKEGYVTLTSSIPRQEYCSKTPTDCTIVLSLSKKLQSRQINSPGCYFINKGGKVKFKMRAVLTWNNDVKDLDLWMRQVQCSESARVRYKCWEGYDEKKMLEAEFWKPPKGKPGFCQRTKFREEQTAKDEAQSCGMYKCKTRKVEGREDARATIMSIIDGEEVPDCRDPFPNQFPKWVSWHARYIKEMEKEVTSSDGKKWIPFTGTRLHKDSGEWKEVKNHMVLDIDWSGGYGPETVTLANPPPGDYQIAVEQFTKDEGAEYIISAQPEVRIYIGGDRSDSEAVQIRCKIKPECTDQTLWSVATIKITKGDKVVDAEDQLEYFKYNVKVLTGKSQQLIYHLNMPTGPKPKKRVTEWYNLAGTAHLPTNKDYFEPGSPRITQVRKSVTACHSICEPLDDRDSECMEES